MALCRAEILIRPKEIFSIGAEMPENAARESSGEEASKHTSAQTSQLHVGDMTSHSNNVSDNIKSGEHEASEGKARGQPCTQRVPGPCRQMSPTRLAGSA